MSTPTIPAGNLFMNATLYTGNGGTQVITNGGTGQSFAPDFVWYKDRSNARDHGLFDSVRGVTNYLASNLSSAEQTVSGVTAFNSNGFTLGGSVNSNANGETYVGWQWKAGGTAVSNTAGSITSQVSANTTSGFSIVTYTGNSAVATIGHGLGAVPQFIVVFRRNAPSGRKVYSPYLTSGYILELYTSDGQSANATAFNSTTPTSSVFSVGNYADTNASGGTYVAYCWAPIAGYSAFGSYTGNGSADGPFIYTGFRPRFVLIKRYDSGSAENWRIVDTARETYNIQGASELYPNSSAAEGGGTNFLDIISNGFKIRNSLSGSNANNGTYIYAAFAENPFKYANAR